MSIAVGTVGLLLASAPLVAQSDPNTTSGTPATDAVGPRELQNFSLSGTVTRPADQPAPTTAQPEPTASKSAPTEPRSAPVRQASRDPKADSPPSGGARATPSALPATSAVTDDIPPASSQIATAAAAPPAVAAPTAEVFPPTVAEPTTLAPGPGLSLLPWLIVAVALGAGAAFLFFRNRSRTMVAGGPQLDLFAPPEPQQGPAPPRPAPPRATAPPPPAFSPPERPGGPGIVSSGLRGWLEIAMVPMRCIVEDHQITIDFDLDLFNSGSAAVRGVLVEALMLNAGANQSEEIAAFFAKPAGPGERIDVIGPLKRQRLSTRVVTSREHVRMLQIGERQVFVPLLAFTAHYRAGSFDGQTSVSYLIGRDGNGEKLSPFRLDLGPRLFRGLGARLLPVTVRR